jgi:hypothetical protein
MGREVKRVALDFQWPLNKVWKGFLNPHDNECRTCAVCNGLGLSKWALGVHRQWYGQVPFHPSFVGLPPLEADNVILIEQARRKTEQSPDFYGTGPDAITREATRLANLFNTYKSNHLTQSEIDVLFEAGKFDGRFDKVRNPDGSWFDRVGTITPEVYTATAISHFMGPDYGALLPALEKIKGSSYKCETCDGEGTIWSSDAVRHAAEEWEPTEPPEGEGWQLWETVSEGSPVSGVFATAEELAAWLAGPESSQRGAVTGDVTEEQWLAFLMGPGWAPSTVIRNGVVMSGVAAVV